MVVGESARVKERQTRRRRRPRLLLLLLLCGEARDGSIATTTKTFPRSRSTFAPLEKARRSNWVTDRPTLVLPPPPAILPYHERRPFFLAPILPLPRLNFRLVSTSPRLVRISQCAHTPLFSHFFSLLPFARARRRRRNREERKTFPSLTRIVTTKTIDTRQLTSLSLVGRKFKFRNKRAKKSRLVYDEEERRVFSRLPIDRHRLLYRSSVTPYRSSTATTCTGVTLSLSLLSWKRVATRAKDNGRLASVVDYPSTSTSSE